MKLLFMLLSVIAWAEEKGADLVPTDALVIEESSRSRKIGGSSSIGTDAVDMRTQTAWYYGTKPIVTCFNAAENFGQSEKQIKSTIEASLKTWREYFALKKIVKEGGAQSPSVNFKFIGKCKGDEDLVLFFGTGPIFGGLQDLKAVQRLNFPAAYVNKTHMTRDLKWSKGYVRIVSSAYYTPDFPNWGKPGALAAVLTHELGHVLGFAHTPGTIMQAELVDRVFSDQPVAALRVDGAKQLVSCAECSASYKLAVGGYQKGFFERVGLKGESKLRLLQSPSGFDLSDGKIKVRVTETSRSQSDMARTLVSNFATPLNNQSETYNLYAFVSATSQKIPVILEYNSASANGAIVLRSAENGEILEVGRFERE